VKLWFRSVRKTADRFASTNGGMAISIQESLYSASKPGIPTELWKIAAFGSGKRLEANS
jgi:hypothetical protein